MIDLEKEPLPTRGVDLHLDENLHSYYVSRECNEAFARVTDVPTNTFRSASQWMSRALKRKKNATADTFLIEDAEECYIRNVEQVFEKNAGRELFPDDKNNVVMAKPEDMFPIDDDYADAQDNFIVLPGLIGLNNTKEHMHAMMSHWITEPEIKKNLSPLLFKLLSDRTQSQDWDSAFLIVMRALRRIISGQVCDAKVLCEEFMLLHGIRLALDGSFPLVLLASALGMPEPRLLIDWFIIHNRLFAEGNMGSDYYLHLHSHSKMEGLTCA